jgi:hypothetical protein
MNPEPVKLILPKSILQEANKTSEERDLKYLKKYDLYSFDSLVEPNIPASVKQYHKLLKDYNSPSDIEFQKIIDDYASKFDIKFCNGLLLKSGSINLALKKDNKYLSACPDYAHGMTYCYPKKRRWDL